MDQKSVIQTNQFSTTLFSLMVMDPSKIIRFVKIFLMLNYAQVRIYQTLAFYGVVLEMPQKVYGGDILHVMAFAKKFETPKNQTFSVFLFFLFEI